MKLKYRKQTKPEKRIESNFFLSDLSENQNANVWNQSLFAIATETTTKNV